MIQTRKRMLLQVTSLFVFVLWIGTEGSNETVWHSIDSASLMYGISSIDYDWPRSDVKDAFESRGEYIMENNIITGIKIYKDTVYVTVPRWRHGVPSTLNTLSATDDGRVILKPFPNWSANKAYDCRAFQYVQSMEIDPNTGIMWIIDTGRVNTINAPSPPDNLCPAKVWLLDINSNTLLRTYEFPDHVASRSSNFLNDIVLDYIDGEAKYAYITDTNDAKLYVYDYTNNDSWYFEDDSMRGVNGGRPIDGIAMSSDFRYVYYTTLSERGLFAIPTFVLRNKSSNFQENVRFIGFKTGRSDGMVFGQRSLFFANIDQNAVKKVQKEHQLPLYTLNTEETIISSNVAVRWADTFAFNGTDLWFVANNLSAFIAKQMDFSGNTTNMYIWKLGVGEHGYLWKAVQKTMHHRIPGIFG